MNAETLYDLAHVAFTEYQTVRSEDPFSIDLRPVGNERTLSISFGYKHGDLFAVNIKGFGSVTHLKGDPKKDQAPQTTFIRDTKYLFSLIDAVLEPRETSGDLESDRVEGISQIDETTIEGACAYLEREYQERSGVSSVSGVEYEIDFNSCIEEGEIRESSEIVWENLEAKMRNLLESK